MRCDVGEEHWSMWWSGEVVPEPAMIPDLSVFSRAASAHSQAVTTRDRDHLVPSQLDERQATPRAREQPNMPNLLKLPFLLFPAGERKALRADQPNVCIEEIVE